MYFIWLIWFCAVDLWMLTPLYVLHQQREVSWNPSWTDPGLSLTQMTTLLRTVFFWKCLIEETGLPTCVFSARESRLVTVCITLPGLDRAPPNGGSGLLEASSLPTWGEASGTGSPRSLPGSHSQAEPPSDPHMGYAAGTLHPRPDPESGSGHPQGGATARPGSSLARTVAELRTMRPQGTLSREQSPHLRKRKPLGIFRLNKFLGRKYSVYKVEMIHGTKSEYFRFFSWLKRRGLKSIHQSLPCVSLSLHWLQRGAAQALLPITAAVLWPGAWRTPPSTMQHRPSSKQAASGGWMSDNSGAFVEVVRLGQLLHRQDVALNGQIFLP